MLTREPSLQMLSSLIRILGLGFIPVPRVYPTEAVADPAPRRESTIFREHGADYIYGSRKMTFRPRHRWPTYA